MCMCVCVCVLSHISPLERLFVLNGGRKFCGFFSETTLLQRSSTPSIDVQSTESAHAHYSIYHVLKAAFVGFVNWSVHNAMNAEDSAL